MVQSLVPTIHRSSSIDNPVTSPCTTFMSTVLATHVR
ncbi:Uncharacterised protein [Mycobacteroides abscessus subsp. abscessus]|nr:Uncharacterised protein [Mycobacteroides abscessus subsp. abscessus]SKU98771.1 Uncharacterised protein [Mycobacteroides abscessus subsp. abscessus]